jgi:hypothetical protein
MKWKVLLLPLLVAAFTLGCEESSDDDDSSDSEPFITYSLAADCAEDLPNGLEIIFDGVSIGTVTAGSTLIHDTTAGEHTWSAESFGTHTVDIPENGFIQPLICPE